MLSERDFNIMFESSVYKFPEVNTRVCEIVRSETEIYGENT